MSQSRVGVRRQRTRVRTAPQRTASLAVASLVGMGALGGLAWKGIGVIRDSKEGTFVGAPQIETVVLPETPAYLVAAIDRDGRPAALFVMSPNAEGGGSIVVVPTQARVDTRDPTKPTRPIDTYGKADSVALTDAVGGLLGIHFVDVFTLDASALSSFLAPLGPVTFGLDKDVVDTDASKAVKVAFSAGATTVAGADAARFVLARTIGDPEQPRLARIDTFWKAALAPNPARPAADASATGAIAIMNQMLKGKVAVTTLTGDPVVDVKLNPLKIDMVGIDVAAMRQLMAETLPGAVSPANGGLHIELRDPFDDARVRKELIGRLTFLKANVIWSHAVTTARGVETVLDYENPNKKAAVDFYSKSLGAKVISNEIAQAVDNVDLVVTIGQDLHDEIAKSLPTAVAGPLTTVASGAPATTIGNVSSTKA
jgi:hypothetical protein